MRAFSLFVALFAFSAAPLPAAPRDAPERIFQGRDLFGLQYATDPQIRPDGKAVAYVRVSYDVMKDTAVQTIWLIDVDTGSQAPLVSGPGRHGSPRWSPDGKRLAYISTVNGGRSQVFIRWLASGESAQVADLTEAPGNLTWSPDGAAIAFTMLILDDKSKLGEAPPRPEGATWAEPLQVITDVVWRGDGAGSFKPGYTHVFIVSADGGAPRQLTFGAFHEPGKISWSPDGRYLYVTGNRTEGWQRDPVNSEIYRVALADGAITAVTTRSGPDFAPAVSPDGSKVAYLGYDDQRMSYQDTRVYIMDAGGGQPRVLTDKLDRSIDDVVWSPDGRSLYILYVDHAVTKVARISLTGRLEAVADGLSATNLDRPYTGGELSVASNGAVAFTTGGPHRPSDIAVVRSGKVRQLTRLNEDLFRDKTLGEVKPLAVKSSFDGRPIDSWLVTPPNFAASRKYPLILEIHGGPWASYGPLFSTDYQLYAAAGYVVLYTNPRGSTSYGEEFAQLIHHKYPSEDYDDLMSAVDTAIATGFVDPENLFVTGGSGGGVLTAWIVGRTDRFRAAATQKPVINWVSAVLTTDISTRMPKYWFAKTPWEDPETYWKQSPLSLVGSVNTPTLIVVGDQDLRTPLSDSEQYYNALQFRGIPTALVKVPGASHGGLTARPSQSAAKASAILAWFDRYRKAPTASASR